MMRSLFLLTAAVCTHAIAQTPTNVFEIYSGCTNFTSRGSIGASSGDYLLQVRSSHFAGIGHDPSGNATRLVGFRYVTQDQNGVTPETYSLVIRADQSGTPDCSASGLLLNAGPINTPPSTTIGPVAWQITATLTTVSTALPLCNTYYQGAQFPAAPGWTAGSDGQSLHITDYPLGDLAAPNAPSLTWNCLNGTPVQPNFLETVRMDTVLEASVLNMGNVDPTTTVTCLVGLGHRSFGAGGMWPQCSGLAGPRNDGLDCRVRDSANGGGLFALFLGTNVGCPGLAIGTLGNGALYLNPAGAFVQVAAGALSATGEGIATVIPPNTPACRAAVNRFIDFQAFSVGSTFALPGNFSNRASVNYLP